MQNKQWLPWQQIMAFGLGKLRLEPNSFWAMTLREIDAAIEGHFGKPSDLLYLPRSGLDELIRLYPDEKMDHSNE